MRSAARGGISLLEVVLVLAIAAVLVMALPSCNPDQVSSSNGSVSANAVNR